MHEHQTGLGAWPRGHEGSWHRPSLPCQSRDTMSGEPGGVARGLVTGFEDSRFSSPDARLTG